MIKYVLGAVAALALAGSAQAASVTYNISSNFGFSTSTSNVNGGAPFTGGTLDGFLTFDTSGASPTLADWKLDVTQPGRFAALLRSAIYTPTSGDATAETGLPAFAGYSSVSQGEDGATFFDYGFNPFVGFGTASGYARLNLAWDDDEVGGSILNITGGERYGNCFPNFGFFGRDPACTGITGTQGGLNVMAEISGPVTAPVPLPAGIVLLGSALAGLGLNRSRKARRTSQPG